MFRTRRRRCSGRTIITGITPGAGRTTGISQARLQLGEDLQSADMASVQKAYSTFEQDLQQHAIANGALEGMGSTAVNTSA